jgi:hypothetical protein
VQAGQTAQVPAAAEPSIERLRTFERSGRWLLYGCLALFVVESAYDAYTGPATLGQALLDWPAYVFVVLVASAIAAAIPLARGATTTIRIVALIVMYGALAIVGSLLMFLALYTVAMSNFD